MLGRSNDDGMTQEELIDLRQEKQQEQSREHLAQSMAQQAMSTGGPAAPGYWDIVGSADISRGPDDGLGDFTATEMSGMNALGNISKDDWESWGWRTETEFWTMLNEMHDQDSKMGDDDVRIMYGEERPELSNEKARRLRNASQVKKLMNSLSVNARGLRSGTEIHAVTKREEQEETQEEEGLLDRAKQKLV